MRLDDVAALDEHGVDALRTADGGGSTSATTGCRASRRSRAAAARSGVRRRRSAARCSRDDAPSSFAGVEFEQHRLDRADRRPATSRASGSRGRSAPWPRAAWPAELAAQRDRHAGRAGLRRRSACRARRNGADSGSKRSATLRYCRGRPRTGTATGRSSRPRRNRRARRISSSWHSSDGTSTMAPSLTLVGQWLAVAAQDGASRARRSPRRLRRTRRTSATIGNIILQLAPAGGLEQRAQLRAQQAGPVEAEADRAPAERRVLLLDRPACRAAPCRRRYRACGTSPAVSPAASSTARVERVLLARRAGSCEAIMNCSSVRNRPMPAAPALLEMRQVDQQPGIDQQADLARRRVVTAGRSRSARYCSCRRARKRTFSA